jgi:hypothetical protein
LSVERTYSPPVAAIFSAIQSTSEGSLLDSRASAPKSTLPEEEREDIMEDWTTPNSHGFVAALPNWGAGEGAPCSEPSYSSISFRAFSARLYSSIQPW